MRRHRLKVVSGVVIGVYHCRLSMPVGFFIFGVKSRNSLARAIARGRLVTPSFAYMLLMSRLTVVIQKYAMIALPLKFLETWLRWLRLSLPQSFLHLPCGPTWSCARD